MPKKAVVSDAFFTSESSNAWTCMEDGGGGGGGEREGWMSKSELLNVQPLLSL